MEVIKPKSRVWVLALIAVLSILTAEVFKYSAVFQTMELKVLDMRYGMQYNLTKIVSPCLNITSSDDFKDICDSFAEQYAAVYSPEDRKSVV